MRYWRVVLRCVIGLLATYFIVNHTHGRTFSEKLYSDRNAAILVGAVLLYGSAEFVAFLGRKVLPRSPKKRLVVVLAGCYVVQVIGVLGLSAVEQVVGSVGFYGRLVGMFGSLEFGLLDSVFWTFPAVAVISALLAVVGDVPGLRSTEAFPSGNPGARHVRGA